MNFRQVCATQDLIYGGDKRELISYFTRPRFGNYETYFKWKKTKTKEARLILQSGIKIQFTNISESTAFLLQGRIHVYKKKKKGRALQNIGKKYICPRL